MVNAENEQYIQQNTNQCPRCHAAVQRNGGCNHVTCRLCGEHFCYVCGGQWPRQGTEFYNCRFAPAAEQGGPGNREDMMWTENCVSNFHQMVQDCSRFPVAGRRIDELNNYVGLGLEPGFAAKCAAGLADDHRVLRHCYALEE